MYLVSNVVGIERTQVDRWISAPVTRSFDISLIFAWTNAGDLRRHRAHYDVTVMISNIRSQPDWAVHDQAI